MKKQLRSVLAVLLSLLCLLPVFSLAAGAANAQVDLPVVYVAGKFTPIYDKSLTTYDDEQEMAKHQLYQLDPSITAVMLEENNRNALIRAYNLASVTGKWDLLGDKIYEIIEPQFRELKLNGNGEITNGSHIKPVAKPKTRLGGYVLNEYTFTYDSRLDPYENASYLNDYINSVLRVTGKKKVNLIGRCLGATLLSTYLTEYGCSKVESAIFYASAFNGVQMMDDYFTGNISFDANRISYYLEHGKIRNSQEFKGTYDTIYNLWTAIDMLGFSGPGVNTANKVWKKIAPKLLPKLVRATYGTWAGHWAMVSADCYEKAKQTIFGDCMDEYAGLIKKIDRYQNEVMSKWPQTLKRLVEQEGLRIAIFAKYNTPLTPLSDKSGQQADGTVELETMSLGAKAAPIGEYYTSEQLRAFKAAGKGKYLSPDDMVDATDCLFPEYTWFIRDVAHDYYPWQINNLFMEIFHSKTQVTVSNNAKHIPQFVAFNSSDKRIYKIIDRETVQPIIDDSVEMDETLPTDPVPNYVIPKPNNFLSKVAEWVQEFVSTILTVRNQLRFDF